jgi:hypothetical protein
MQDILLQTHVPALSSLYPLAPVYRVVGRGGQPRDRFVVGSLAESQPAQQNTMTGFRGWMGRCISLAYDHLPGRAKPAERR